ncbi:hypothetical protein [Billgrantia lactosivorans]|uniref:hypothetical protein n=1 Tax=Billgrantia lactosivorans TaxID=2185141 RepID=UPI000DACB239|nr:hypothetical protein [Halomonas lactosivorans]
MYKVTYIEEYVVPQLFTTAFEAYEFEHRGHARGKGYDKLETFGLLWGYSIPQKGNLPARVVATMATVETSATRHEDWVQPNFDSVIAKKAFFERYWQNIELVGTFHSHPYANLSEVRDIKGWQASPGDEAFWPTFHERVAPEQPLLTHLVITIAKLAKRGWALPDHLRGSEEYKGYELSADDRKFWLRAYASNRTSHPESDEEGYRFSDDMGLQVPALHDFMKWSSR